MFLIETERETGIWGFTSPAYTALLYRYRILKEYNGFFTLSREDNTPSANLKEKVSIPTVGKHWQ